MARRAVWTAVVAGALALALGASVAYGSISDVFSTVHNVGSSGNPTCMQCHTPHKAGGMYLWAMTPSTSLPGLGGLCFSCHDGAIAGQWIPDYATHPMGQGQDCDLCHDAHEDNWMFATDALDPAFQNANLCASGNCHATYMGSDDHPVDVLATAPNLPVDRDWHPTDDFSGTRLFDEPGDVVVDVGDGYMKCATCHVAHGGTGYAMNSMAYSDELSSHSPICENCHQ